MVKMCDHPHFELAEKQVKCIKLFVMHAGAHRELQELGRDTDERLKKDKQDNLLHDVFARLTGYEQVCADITTWVENHADLMEQLQDSEQPSPELMLLDVPVVKTLAAAAPAETDSDAAADCLQARVAQLAQTIEGAVMSLRKESGGLYASGPHNWKLGLDDASLQDVLIKAGSTVGKINGDVFRKSLDNAKQALGPLHVGLPYIP